MTGGELVCDRDHDIDEPYELGYQPVYAKSNGKPGFVIVYDHAREQVDKLKLHHLVEIARSKKKGDTVSITYAGLNRPLYTSTRADLMRPADLTESLLRIWKMPELTLWYRSTHGGDNALSLPAKQEPPKKVSSIPPAEGKVPFPAEELATVLDEAARRAKERSERETKTAAWLREHAHGTNGNGSKK